MKTNNNIIEKQDIVGDYVVVEALVPHETDAFPLLSLLHKLNIIWMPKSFGDRSDFFQDCGYPFANCTNVTVVFNYEI